MGMKERAQWDFGGHQRSGPWRQPAGHLLQFSGTSFVKALFKLGIAVALASICPPADAGDEVFRVGAFGGVAFQIFPGFWTTSPKTLVTRFSLGSARAPTLWTLRPIICWRHALIQFTWPEASASNPGITMESSPRHSIGWRRYIGSTRLKVGLRIRAHFSTAVAASKRR